MCYTCLLLYTPEPVITPRVLAALDAINATGTTSDQRRSSTLLRPIFADFNVDDDLFRLIALHTFETAEPWEQTTYLALSLLTEAERVTVVAMLAGYVSRTGELRADIAERATSAPRRLLTSFGKSRSRTVPQHTSRSAHTVSMPRNRK